MFATSLPPDSNKPATSLPPDSNKPATSLSPDSNKPETTKFVNRNPTRMLAETLEEYLNFVFAENIWNAFYMASY